MFNTNPFDALNALISTDIQQGYLILMAIMVFLGTVLDMMHKKSAKYFAMDTAKNNKNAKRPVGVGEKAGLAIAVAANEILTSAEFCNTKRRISHMMIMYGFILYVLATVVMIFGLSEATLWANLWHIGAISLCVGGYWFWFFIRVDVNAEGAKWYKLVKADMFILGLLTSATFGLVWSYMQSSGGVVAIDASATSLFFALFVIATTFLFSTVMWSKFAHMFFKPAAAHQKRVAHADGGNLNLPADYDLSDPAVHARYPDVPQYMGKNPPNMGPGIRREPPNHY